MLALELLGPVVLRRAGAVLPLTIRKTSALLVLLALGGAMVRPRVVALLWPDLDEATGRRNLRRELARLREAGADDAVQADGDRLALAPTLAVDAGAFVQALRAGEPEAALQHWRGTPADGLDLADAQPFMDWLAAERDGLTALRRQALGAAAEAAERRGDIDAALARLQQLLADDPLQELHHRAVMRLLAAAGRREAALAQYRRCADLLRDELGLVPMAETEALAAALRGQPEPAVPVAALPGRLLPAELPFVGRGAEVAALEAAWQAGAAVLIEGLAGIGKSRLALDVAAAHGACALVRCRPADTELPYAAFARAIQCLCGQPPDRAALSAAGLAPWAVDELARLLPALGAPPPAIRSAEEQARFLEACIQAWQALAADSFDVVLLDDWHLADNASQKLLIHVVQRRRERAQGGAREWLLMRPELDTVARQRLADGLQAVSLCLQPLGDAEVLALIRQLSGVAQPVRFAARLQRSTGGNPFFIAETLRLLADTGALRADAQGRWSTEFDGATEDYRELPLPPSVRDAVRARVQRLPDAARRLLEAASLAAEPFVPGLLAAACALSELEATAALEQALDAALVHERPDDGYGFSHDLVRQALDADLAPQRRRLVHRRLALAAEAAGESPAVAAQHHEAGGDRRRAAPLRMAAGDRAERLQDMPQAIEHWQRGLADDPVPAVAARLHRRLMRSLRWVGQPEAAQSQQDALRTLAQSGALTPAEQRDAWIDIAGLLARSERPAEALSLLDTVASGGTRLQQALARMYRVDALRDTGQTEASRREAHALLADTHLPASKRADLLDALAQTEFQAGRFAEALPFLAQAEAACRQSGDHFGTARGLYRRGSVLFNLQALDEAEAAFRGGLAIARRMGMTTNTMAFLQGLCELHQARGEMDALLAAAQEAWTLLPDPPAGLLGYVFRAAFVQAHSARGEWDAAWAHAQIAAQSLLAVPPSQRLEAAGYLPLELFAWRGDSATPARLRAELAADLSSGPTELVQAQRLHFVRHALAAGDAAAARQELAAMPPLAELADVAQRQAWQVAEAATLLAEGQAVAALAALPGDEPPLSPELQARGLAVQLLAAQHRAGGPPPGSIARAQRLLEQPGLHAVAALALRRALAAADAPPAI